MPFRKAACYNVGISGLRLLRKRKKKCPRMYAYDGEIKICAAESCCSDETRTKRESSNA